jgi:phage tail tube protein FII
MFSEDLATAQSTGKISVQDPLPILFRKVERGRALGDAGAIDQNVHLPKLFQDVVAQGFERCSIVHI